MAWSVVGSISPRKQWEFTAPVTGTYFRLTHVDPPYQPVFWLAQAQPSLRYELFSLQQIKDDLPLIVRLPKPPVFSDRVLGIKSNKVESRRWQILIEVSDVEDEDFFLPSNPTGGLTWVAVTGSTQQMANNTGYFATSQSTVDFMLPLAANTGDSLAVIGTGSGGWRIKQNAGQTILIAAQTSETGVRGGIKSSHHHDCVELLCTAANTHWVARSVSGSPRTIKSYANAVLALNPYLYWRLGETSGTVAADSSPNNRGATYSGNYTLGVTGLLAGDSNLAVRCNGSAFICSSAIIPNPQNFTLEFIFQTTNVNCGMVNFGDTRTVSPSSFDRQVYLDAQGRLNFYVFPGGAITTPQAYNDGKKHHCVVVCDAQGRRIFVDGIQVVSAAASAPTVYNGYWALGFARTPNTYLTGVIDEFAYYTTSLSAADIADHAALIN